MPKTWHEEITDLKTENAQLREALAVVRRCAIERLDDMTGEATTYEEAFRLAEIGCGALAFIRDHADATLEGAMS
jgi:hypothetical protein